MNSLYLRGGFQRRRRIFEWSFLRPGWQDHPMAPEKIEYSQQTAQREVQKLLVQMSTLGALV